MDFVIFTQYYPPEVGAAAVRLQAIAKELKRQGHAVRVVTGMPNYPTGRIFDGYRGKAFSNDEVEGIPVYRAWMYAAQGTGLKRLLNYFTFMVMAFFPLYKVSRGADYIIVESPPPFLGLPGLLVSKLRRVPMIFYIADLWPEWPARAGMFHNKTMVKVLTRLASFIYKRARFINVVTKGMIEDLKAGYQIPDEKILWLPNGVDTKLFEPVGPKIIDGKKVFVYAGNHGIYNWPIVIVQAARLLKDSRSDISFQLVGDGSQKPEIKEYVERYNLTNVELVDPVPQEEVAVFLKQAYAALVTYKADYLSRPAKMFPAMACALPIIYSGSGEGAAIVNEVGCGIVVSPEDPEKLAKAVGWIADNEDQSFLMGRKGAELILGEYSWEHITKSWIKQVEKRGK